MFYLIEKEIIWWPSLQESPSKITKIFLLYKKVYQTNMCQADIQAMIKTPETFVQLFDKTSLILAKIQMKHIVYGTVVAYVPYYRVKMSLWENLWEANVLQRVVKWVVLLGLYIILL